MIIQTQPELAAFCERLRSARVISLDTEFAGEGRYYPEVGAIQIAAADQIALIDPLALRDLSPLLPVLTDPGAVKVLHAGEQDLEILFRLLGRPVAPVFDAQIAAALLGYGDQISFRNLLELTTGVQIEKGDTFTDWLRRPLNASQLKYALDDVRYLGRVYERLNEELRAKGRLDWAREEFRELETAERFLPADERQLYQRVKGAERLTPQALGLLQELTAWREQTARRLNIPPSRVALEPVLVELSRRPRRAVRDLAEVRGLHSRQIERFGAEMIEALRRGTRNSPPPIRRVPSLHPSLEPTVDFLSLCLRAVANEQAISPRILANHNDLAAVAAFGEKADVPLLRGWRRQAAGTALLSAREGKAVARIVSSTHEVLLEWQDSAGEPSRAAGPGAAPNSASKGSQEDSS